MTHKLCAFFATPVHRNPFNYDSFSTGRCNRPQVHPFRRPMMGSTGKCLLFSFFVVTRGELSDYLMSFGDMKVMAGYYTAEGKYLGGIPRKEYLHQEHGIFGCKEGFFAEANGTTEVTPAACLEWRGDQWASAKWCREKFPFCEYTLSSCTCDLVINQAYCSEWVCSKSFEQTRSKSSGNGGTYTVKTLGEYSVSCKCEQEHETGRYCDSWSCEWGDSRSGGEEYSCLRTSPSGYYCDLWSGHTIVSGAHTAACQCLSEWNGNSSCYFWECESRFLDKCGSGDSWCNLGVSIGVGGGFGLVGVIMMVYGVYMCTTSTFDRDIVAGVCGFLLGMFWCCG